MILDCRKTEPTKVTKAKKKSSENNSIAYFRIAWGLPTFFGFSCFAWTIIWVCFFHEIALVCAVRLI